MDNYDKHRRNEASDNVTPRDRYLSRTRKILERRR